MGRPENDQVKDWMVCPISWEKFEGIAAHKFKIIGRGFSKL
jgi:hypothetical protein